ncbi:MAG: DUF4386 domain-containing protein [Chryseolinea sp.]
MSRTNEFSPNVYARVGGVLYLIIIFAGLFAEIFVRGKLFVPGDATATANQIIASPFLWRVGICVDLIMQVCDIPLMVILYVLLRPVNRNLTLLNLLFNLIQTAVLVANKLNLVMALIFLGDVSYLKSIDPNQLHSLSYLSIKLHDHGLGVGLIFFGVVCIIEGFLIFKSGYFPKVLGVMMAVAGVCYIVNSFSLLLAPPVASLLFPLILLPCVIAEFSLAIWMIVKGVNLAKWRECV